MIRHRLIAVGAGLLLPSIGMAVAIVAGVTAVGVSSAVRHLRPEHHRPS